MKALSLLVIYAPVRVVGLLLATTSGRSVMPVTLSEARVEKYGDRPKPVTVYCRQAPV